MTEQWIVKALGGGVALLAGVALIAPCAFAQPTRTWISGVGADSGTCTRTAPCRTFPYTIGQTAAGGVITVLDSGFFGPFAIPKSITIDAQGVEAIVGAASGGAINVSAPADAFVTLRGLFVEGFGSGTVGIVVNSVGSLRIINTTVQRFQASGAAEAHGLWYAPASSGEVTVLDSIFLENGRPSDAAIFIRPQGATNHRIVLNRVHLDSNGVGVEIDGNGGLFPPNGIRFVMRESVVTNSAQIGVGVGSEAGGLLIRALIERSTIANNPGGSGIFATGGVDQVFMRVSASTVTGNLNGLHQAGGAFFASYGDNLVIENSIQATVGTISAAAKQ